MSVALNRQCVDRRQQLEQVRASSALSALAFDLFTMALIEQQSALDKPY